MHSNFNIIVFIISIVLISVIHKLIDRNQFLFFLNVPCSNELLTLRFHFILFFVIFSTHFSSLSPLCNFAAFIYSLKSLKHPWLLSFVFQSGSSGFGNVGELLAVMAGESQIAFACFLLGRWCFDDARWEKKG